MHQRKYCAHLRIQQVSYIQQVPGKMSFSRRFECLMFALFGLKLFNLNLLLSSTEAFRRFESTSLGNERTSEMMLLKRDLYSTACGYGQIR